MSNNTIYMHVPVLLHNDTVTDQVNVLRYKKMSSNTKNILDTYKRECSGDSHAKGLWFDLFQLYYSTDPWHTDGRSEWNTWSPCCGVSEDPSLSNLVLLCTCVCECTHAALCACMGERACVCSWACVHVCVWAVHSLLCGAVCVINLSPLHTVIAQQEAGHICWLLCLVCVCGWVSGWWWWWWGG